MDNIFIDTNILIDFSKGYDSILSTLRERQLKGKVELYINPIVIAEFFCDLQLNDPKKYSQAEAFIQFFNFLPITKEIGVLTAELLRNKTVQYMADALIASTCLVHSLTLCTRNKKHFREVKNLQFEKI